MSYKGLHKPLQTSYTQSYETMVNTGLYFDRLRSQVKIWEKIKLQAGKSVKEVIKIFQLKEWELYF